MAQNPQYPEPEGVDLSPVLIEPEAPKVDRSLPVSLNPPQENDLGAYLDDPIKILPFIHPGLNEDQDLSLNSAYTARRKTLNQEMDQAHLDLMSGKALEEIKAEQATVAQDIERIITEMQKPLDIRPAALRSEIGQTINRMETELYDGSWEKRINPRTGTNYTREQYTQELQDFRRRGPVEAGLEVDPGEAGGMLLAQLLDPQNARQYYGVHRQLQEERLKITQDHAVRAWEHNQKIQTLRLQRLATREGILQASASQELQRMDGWRRAIWENQQAIDRFDTQIQNGNWQLAFKEANDALITTKALPPGEVRASLLRFNNLVALANSYNPPAPLTPLTEDQIEEQVKQAEFREREKVVRTIIDDWYKMRVKWEEFTDADLKELDKYLASKGPLWSPNANDGKGGRVVLTRDDIAIALGMNKLTPGTKSSILNAEEMRKFRESQLRGQIIIGYDANGNPIFAQQGGKPVPTEQARHNQEQEEANRKKAQESVNKLPGTIATARSALAGIKATRDQAIQKYQDELGRVKGTPLGEFVDATGRLKNEAETPKRFRDMYNKSGLKKALEASEKATNAVKTKEQSLAELEKQLGVAQGIVAGTTPRDPGTSPTKTASHKYRLGGQYYTEDGLRESYRKSILKYPDKRAELIKAFESSFGLKWK